MYDSSTVCQRYIGIADNVMALFVLLFAVRLRAVVKRLVLLKFQLLALIGFKDFHILAQHLLYQCVSHIVGITVCGLYLYIFLIWVDAESHIAWKSPGSGGPCQNVSILILYLKPGNGGAFLYILIALSYLMGGQRSSAAWTVGYYLKALI